jgi:hypothetical protein
MMRPRKPLKLRESRKPDKRTRTDAEKAALRALFKEMPDDALAHKPMVGAVFGISDASVDRHEATGEIPKATYVGHAKRWVVGVVRDDLRRRAADAMRQETARDQSAMTAATVASATDPNAASRDPEASPPLRKGGGPRNQPEQATEAA